MTSVLGLVSFRIFPTQMGGHKGVVLFYKYLSQHVDVLLAVSTDNAQSEELKTIKTLYPNKKIYLNLFEIGELKKIIAENNIDVIVAEHSYTGWIANKLSKATGKPFIIHSHNIESKRFHQMSKWWWKIYRRYEERIHQKASHNFFISEEDREFALKEFHISPKKCSVITYGIEPETLREEKHLLRKKLDLHKDKIILLFNGTLDYKPNYDAVMVLINEIEPLLRSRISNYQIVITGNRATKDLLGAMFSNENISYKGFVDDVNLYYQSADLFLNPVINDSGVKTKLIEAIANNCTSVSTQSGAVGMRKDFCGDKLVIVNDSDWNSFAGQIIRTLKKLQSKTPQSFYDYYSWINITKNASQKINELVS